MPRIKPLTIEERKNAAIRGEIAKHMAETGTSIPHIAEMLKISNATLYRKLRNPGSFTLKEVRCLRNLFPGINIE